MEKVKIHHDAMFLMSFNIIYGKPMKKDIPNLPITGTTVCICTLVSTALK